MMNIGKLDSNESMGLNIKTGYAPNCVQSSDLKATRIFVILLKAAGIFVILLSQDGLEATVQKQSSKQSVRKVRTEAVYADVLQN